MVEYVNIDDDDQLNIQYTKPKVAILLDDSIPSVDYKKKEVVIIEEGVSSTNITKLEIVNNSEELLPSINIEEEIIPDEEIECIKDIDISYYYGDIIGKDSFKRSNLFSELTDEYQRAIARRNLGINDNLSLIWGNIKGNILNQKDIYGLISALVLEANSLNSEQLNSISLDKDYMFSDDPPTTLTCSWDYKSEVTYQKINGITLSPEIRTYTFNNVSSDLIILLEYEIENKKYAKTLMFTVYIPTYYGISDVYESLNKTKEDNFIINCNQDEYAYIIIPDNGNSKIFVDGIMGGFMTTMIANISDVYYYVYRSKNSGLGELNIKIS